MAKEELKVGNRVITEFENFAKKVAIKVPQQPNSYRNRFGRSYSSIPSDGYSKEDIRQILESGDPGSIRELSRYFSRFCGTYARPLQYYATLLNYGYVIVPHYDVDSKPKKIKTAYKKISQYIKDFNFEYILPKINYTILTEGIYYAILVEDDERPVFYRLPAKYCRSRFFDGNGLPILEIHTSYFEHITDSDIERRQILKLFPKYVQQTYAGKNGNARWVEIPPSQGGFCFFFTEDQTPPFVSSTMAAADLESARNRETARDNNELEKILIHRLPINKEDGELLFTLPEAEMLHQSICNMLEDNETINVLTTYGEVSLEGVQDTQASSTASATRIQKYLDSVYDEIGTSSAIFNADSATTALTYSIKKDISLMYAWSKQYELAVNAILQNKAKNDQLYFSIKVLATSSIFRKEDADMYLKMAQYGYPRSTVSATIGLDMVDLAQVTDFENNVLHLEKSMIPLQSSYTTPGGENSSNSGKNSGKSTTGRDLTNEGGRPQKSVEERADRTNANIDGST